jgi:hypothetical protein
VSKPGHQLREFGVSLGTDVSGQVFLNDWDEFDGDIDSPVAVRLGQLKDCLASGQLHQLLDDVNLPVE